MTTAPTSERASAAPFRETFTGPNGHSLLPGGFGRGTFAIAPRTPMAVSGSGCRLRDDSGRELIDLHNNFTSMLHGYAHPAIVEAAGKAMANGSSFGLPTMYEVDHAALMLDRMRYVDQIRYTNSGTEAVMLALRLARAVTGRDKIVFVRAAYHGHSDLALIPQGTPARRGIPDGVIADVVEVAVNDTEGLTAAFGEQAGAIAAVVVDPMPSRAGLIATTTEFWRLARALCDKAGSVLVSDEVIGLRQAYEGAAVQHGVRPDLVTMGKIIGGGTPVGAVAGTAAVMSALDPFGDAIEHAGTFAANPVTMAAGLAGMQLFTREEVDRLNGLGDRIRTQLLAGIAEKGWEVRGGGSLFRPFPVGVGAAEAKKAQTALWWAAYEHGVLLGQNVMASLSTPMDEQVVDDLSERLTSAVAEVSV